MSEVQHGDRLRELAEISRRGGNSAQGNQSATYELAAVLADLVEFLKDSRLKSGNQ